MASSSSISSLSSSSSSSTSVVVNPKKRKLSKEEDLSSFTEIGFSNSEQASTIASISSQTFSSLPSSSSSSSSLPRIKPESPSFSSLSSTDLRVGDLNFCSSGVEDVLWSLLEPNSSPNSKRISLLEMAVKTPERHFEQFPSYDRETAFAAIDKETKLPGPLIGMVMDYVGGLALPEGTLGHASTEIHRQLGRFQIKTNPLTRPEFKFLHNLSPEDSYLLFLDWVWSGNGNFLKIAFTLIEKDPELASDVRVLGRNLIDQGQKTGSEILRSMPSALQVDQFQWDLKNLERISKIRQEKANKESDSNQFDSMIPKLSAPCAIYSKEPYGIPLNKKLKEAANTLNWKEASLLPKETVQKLSAAAIEGTRNILDTILHQWDRVHGDLSEFKSLFQKVSSVQEKYPKAFHLDWSELSEKYEDEEGEEEIISVKDYYWLSCAVKIRDNFAPLASNIKEMNALERERPPETLSVRDHGIRRNFFSDRLVDQFKEDLETYQIFSAASSVSKSIVYRVV